MENSNKYLSVEEVASHFNVTPQQVRIYIKKGYIPATQVGKTWVIASDVLDNQEVAFKCCKTVEDQVRKNNEVPPVVALSFFSGAMGLDLGIEKAGINFLLASEFEDNARKTILLNKPEIGLIGDINKYSASDIRRFANINEDQEIDLIVGGPPCQAFSTAGKREAFGDERGNVFLTFIDRILDLKPKYAVIENVRGLLSAPYEGIHRDGYGYPPKTPDGLKGMALLHIITKLQKGGYTVSFNLYNAANYGSPQKRERVVIICSRDGKKAPYLCPTNSEEEKWGLPPWKTLREAISDLNPKNQDYIEFPEKRLKYYRMLKEGQYWKNLPLEYQIEAMGKKLELGGGKTGFLRRLAWDKPSPTLVTDPTMPATDLCHPTENRPLSIQEYKRIQEFPDNWKLFGSIKDQYRQIGNAVPTSLGYAIGKEIMELLNGCEIKRAPEGFPFSRYVNTDDVTFIKKTKKKLKVKDNTPDLFD